MGRENSRTDHGKLKEEATQPEVQETPLLTRKRL